MLDSPSSQPFSPSQDPVSEDPWKYYVQQTKSAGKSSKSSWSSVTQLPTIYENEEWTPLPRPTFTMMPNVTSIKIHIMEYKPGENRWDEMEEEEEEDNSSSLVNCMDCTQRLSEMKI